MSDDTEWGPWIEHDGKGAPVERGTVIEVVRANGVQHVIVFGAIYTCISPPPYKETPTWFHWVGDTPAYGEVIRYRLRRPRRTAFDRIAEIVADPALPITPPEVPQREKVTG